MIVKEGYSVFLPCLKERRQKRLKVNYFFAVSSSSGVLENIEQCYNESEGFNE